MHLEVQVALNFLISFLFNKLPRRRVNQFGEELERALKHKFQGHWYPEKPMKGSAYRCLKTIPPLDPVFELASTECGIDLQDIQDNLPKELSIWIDPGEVSYRLEEKGAIKILYSGTDTPKDHPDREVIRTFNPEAQCFKPIDSVTSQLAGIGLSSSDSGSSSSTASSPGSSGPFGSCPSPTYKPASPVAAAAFLTKTNTPMTFTTATFAQTKFGSTKLKNNNKRSHRMSPTELSHYIKQRALLQQQQQQQQQQQNAVATAAMFAAAASAANTGSQRSRSLSPNPQQPQLVDPSFLLMASGNAAQQQLAAAAAAVQQQQQQGQQFSPPNTRGFNSPVMFDSGISSYLNDLFNNTGAINTSNSKGLPSPPHQRASNRLSPSSFEKNFLSNNSANGSNSLIGSGLNLNLGLATSAAASETNNTGTNAKGGLNFDSMPFNIPYNSQYQHLLVAN